MPPRLLRCRQRDKVFDVNACPGDLQRLAPAGFEVDGHEITLCGRRKDCVVRPNPTDTRTRRGQSEAT